MADELLDLRHGIAARRNAYGAESSGRCDGLLPLLRLAVNEAWRQLCHKDRAYLAGKPVIVKVIFTGYRAEDFTYECPAYLKNYIIYEYRNGR